MAEDGVGAGTLEFHWNPFIKRITPVNIGKSWEWLGIWIVESVWTFPFGAILHCKVELDEAPIEWSNQLFSVSYRFRDPNCHDGPSTIFQPINHGFLPLLPLFSNHSQHVSVANMPLSNHFLFPICLEGPAGQIRVKHKTPAGVKRDGSWLCLTLLYEATKSVTPKFQSRAPKTDPSATLIGPAAGRA